MSQSETLELLDLFRRLPGETRAEILNDMRERVQSRDTAAVRPIAEIREAFAGRWVLLHDLQFEEGTRLVAGRPICEADERRALYQKARELGLTDVAVLFMGEPSRETVYAL